MKRKHNTWIITIAFVLAMTTMVSSCDKDDDDNLIAESGMLVASVSGQNFKSNSSKTYVHYYKTGDELTFYGTDDQERTVRLNIKDFDGTASTWELKGDEDKVSAAYIEETVSSGGQRTYHHWNSTSGEIKISEFSSPGVLKGTFRFTGKNDDGSTKEITSGSFNLSVDEGF